MEKGLDFLFSVTRRIKKISQPRLGYIPIADLNVAEYFDDCRIEKIDSYFSSIQGLAVDYLTRFMNGTAKQTAFKISLMGAEKVDELEKAKALLNRIKGLDEKSIHAACQLVGYDVAFRAGPRYFTSVENIAPNKSVVQNIVGLVNRSIAFLKKNGPVILDGFTFEGGYNDVISSGDGDFLTADTLWDFKVSESKPKINHTLQILVYYILGIHSVHKEFKSIKNLGIYNPELNIAYTISLSDISDEVFYNVSRDVIGYRMPENPEDWRMAFGTSVKAKSELKKLVANELIDTGFSPDKYQDGIHDITIDDYWGYYRKITASGHNSPELRRPKFARTHSVKFIKNSGFIMFVSISEKGATSILQGGSLRKIKKPLQYYYEKLPEYANTVLNKFSRYWDALYNISKQIQSIIPNDKEINDIYKKYVIEQKTKDRFAFSYEMWRKLFPEQYSFSGEVHGCIVDIDRFNHIYLNPYDGSIIPYNAPSMYMKYVYKNIPSLIATQKPEMLLTFNRAIENNIDKESTALILSDADETKSLTVLEEYEIDTYNVPVTDVGMYDVSNRIKQLQKIYDYNLVVVWYDNVLPNNELEEDQKQFQQISFGKDLTLQYENGTIVEDCCRDKFQEGKIKSLPSQPTKITSKKQKDSQKKSYVGRTAVMNCGLKATVIEDFGYYNITVEFEDGLVKRNCRRDKFQEGKIGHKS